MALTADLLTASRGLIAFLLIASLSNGYLKTSAVLLSLAWVTDLLDGRAARAGGEPTRFGERDMDVDTLVGAAVLVGLQLGDAAPAWITWTALILFGVPYLVFRHPTLSMSLQAIAYGLVLVLLWAEAGPLRWLPPATIAVILFVDFERFRSTTLPGFFSGFLELLPERGGEDQ